MSVHGTWVCIANPSQAIRDEFPSVDWSKFPPVSSDSDVVPDLVSVHLQLISNDAKQNAFHTRSVMSAEAELIAEALPWIEECVLQADSAGNYHSTEAVFNNLDAHNYSTKGQHTRACTHVPRSLRPKLIPAPPRPPVPLSHRQGAGA